MYTDNNLVSSPENLRCSIELTDLNLKIDLHQVCDHPYYKVFYKGEKTISEFSMYYNITFDLKGLIRLLNYLALEERVATHEDLTDCLVEYDEEKGKGPRTTYFKKAFQLHSQPEVVSRWVPAITNTPAKKTQKAKKKNNVKKTPPQPRKKSTRKNP